MTGAEVTEQDNAQKHAGKLREKGASSRGLRHATLWVLAAAFSWATVLLASGPLRALRLASPSWVYWPMAILVSAGFWAASTWVPGLQLAAVSFLAIAVVIGLFTEVESWGVGRGHAAIASICALVAGVGVGFGAWCRSMKISPATWLTKWVEPMVVKAKELNPALDFSAESVVSQLPSGLVVLSLVALAIAILSERTWLRAIGSRRRSPRKWTDFKLWDASIFVLMAVLLGAFTQHGVKAVTVASLNALNIMVVLYFFQGMAVVFKALEFFAVGPFWRMLIGFILTFLLALVVAMVGVADYWLEFRNRLKRQTGSPVTGTDSNQN
ncbi:MAG: DUF2232 domain-containing protein [Bdellovibrionales bacterium]|nr:DUF2232 domain-containing protein [Bdellovibrionales bacterium]